MNEQHQIEIKRFVNASEVKLPSEKIRNGILNSFIDKINKGVVKGKFRFNNGLDGIETLTLPEWELAKEIAEKDGWILDQQNDNYNSVTYVMKKK